MDKRNKKLYETIFIINGSYTEEEYTKAFEEIKNHISEYYEIDEIQEIGKKRLAYEVKGNQYGYYVILTVNIFDSDVKDIEKYYKENKNILKSIVCLKY